MKSHYLYSESGGFSPTKVPSPEDVEFIIVDLFCGAGGTTTGFDRARLSGKKCALVIACVNHDPKAIKSHWWNHPEVAHFEEDIRTLDLAGLINIVEVYKVLYPNAKLIVWASLECTNFSKAKGGQPRDADSRTLAEHLIRYVTALNPDYVQIENVVEFMSWGPLDEKGKPVSRKNGSDWLKWRKSICDLGYRDEWRELNSANYGAYTSRNRLFGCFAKPGLPIVWPEPTHAKNPEKAGLFEGLKKWKAVKDVLDFLDEGISIFGRKKPLSPKTLERIYAGLIKYVAGGKANFILKWNSMSAGGRHVPPSVDDPCPTVTVQNRLGMCFIQKHFSGKPEGKVIPVTGPAGTITTSAGQSLVNCSFIQKHFSGNPWDKVVSVEGPTGTITTKANQSIVNTKFIVQRNSGNPESKVVSVDGPARTITGTGGNQDLVQPSFIAKYYGNGDNISSVEEPAGTVTTKDRMVKVQTVWMDLQYGQGKCKSVEEPAGTITAVPKMNKVKAVPFLVNHNFENAGKPVDEPCPTLLASRRHYYIVNPSHGVYTTSAENPCPVIIASQDKAPLYLLQIEEAPACIPVYDDDPEIMVKIKVFMALYGIGDIKMRMLKISELLPIQGFPRDYKLYGNQSDQKKFIGNSVVPHVVKSWCEAMATACRELRKEAA